MEIEYKDSYLKKILKSEDGRGGSVMIYAVKVQGFYLGSIAVERKGRVRLHDKKQIVAIVPRYATGSGTESSYRTAPRCHSRRSAFEVIVRKLSQSKYGKNLLAQIEGATNGTE